MDISQITKLGVAAATASEAAKAIGPMKADMSTSQHLGESRRGMTINFASVLTQRAMRSEANVVRLGHLSNLACFRDTSSMRDIRLNNVDAAGLQVWTDIVPSEESFPQLKIRRKWVRLALR